jgi:hypothetical protein
MTIIVSLVELYKRRLKWIENRLKSRTNGLKSMEEDKMRTGEMNEFGPMDTTEKPIGDIKIGIEEDKKDISRFGIP